VPEQQDRPGPKRARKPAAGPRDPQRAAPRRRTRPPEHAAGAPPVDFQVAAQRLTARAAQITRLKAEVEGGAYRADPTETARAMERRSDA
jgi:hypothetical protein